MMDTLELKTNLHKLIDTINDDSILYGFYKLLNNSTNIEEGSLWKRLSSEEREELLEIEKESHNISTLIPHKDMKKKYAKWL